MSNIGLFYGTTTGKTESAAETIQKEFGDAVTLHNIADVDDSAFFDYFDILRNNNSLYQQCSVM